MSEIRMSFDDMMNDVVTLVKKDGTVVKEGIKAQVSKGSIITFDASLPIEPGDHFVRIQQSGLAEDYIVIDPGYMSGMGGRAGIPNHFQSKVRRSDAPVAPPSTIINNIHGPNARVNINSVDNSTNTNTTITIQPLEVASLIEKIKPHLAALPEDTRTQMQLPIELLESEIRSGKPNSSVLVEGLKSMKVIAEGAAGNLVAAGIGAMIGPMLGG
ncbi:hypothetical protein A7J57_12095 [Agrobacterium tumefaciens]|uniref:Uncharacterized protein n=2 Tax=Agrobacterium tumefaciens TaxID=358 RepID=A0A176XBX5_AGRTU|nr:hypothetical protein A7J57_12095 [Agrobacterium tumefaciens]